MEKSAGSTTTKAMLNTSVTKFTSKIPRRAQERSQRWIRRAIRLQWSPDLPGRMERRAVSWGTLCAVPF